VWLILRTDEAVVASTCKLLLNNDTAANYDRQNIRAANTTVSGTGSAGVSDGWTLNVAGASNASGVFHVMRITFPFYAQTTAQKVGECVMGRADTTGANSIADVQVFNWRSTAAITRIAISAVANNFIAGSRMLIYGR
jgi:hypothetical protein